MKLQELNQIEMTEINGGGLLGTTGSLIQGNLIGPVTIGNFLSLAVNQDGAAVAVSTTNLTSILGGGIGGGLGGLNLGSLTSILSGL